MPSIQEIRTKYPQYSDLSDEQLLDGLHRKFYSDMPREEFTRRLGAQREPTTAETLVDVGEQAVRRLSQGIVGSATMPYRALDWAGEKITGGDFLPNAEDMPLYRPFLEQPEAKTDAGRYAGAAAEAVGASALPVAGMVGMAPRMAALAPTTTPRAIAQSVGRQIVTNPRAAVATDIASATGAGLAQQAAEDEGFGPVGQMVAGVAGGMAPLAATSAVSAPVRMVRGARERARPHAKIESQLGDPSIDDLAESVATGSTTQVAAINRRTLDYLGEEMVRSNGNQQRAVRATIDRLVADGINPTTARDQVSRLLSVHRDSELFFGEYPAVAASNADTRLARNLTNVTDEAAGAIDDSGVHWMLDTVANSGAGASSSRIRNAINDRLPALREQMRDRLQGMSPNRQTIEDADNLIDAMTRQARQEYNAVYNAPGGTAVNYRMLHGILPRIVNRHLNRMRGRSGQQATALQDAIDELYITTANGQRIIMPSLQQLQDMRGAIRGMIENANSPANPRPHIASTLQPLYDDITRLMERASPQWARANRRWADLRIGERARELGDAFAERAGPRFREQWRDFQSLAPQAQDFVRIHFVRKLLDKVENNPDEHDLAKLYSTPHIRRMVRQVLGDEAAVDLARLIRDNRVATKSKRMMGGSPTQPRMQRQEAHDADLGILASFENASVNGFRQWATKYTIGILRERRNRAVADVLTTPMRNVPQVARHLEEMRRSQSRTARFAQRPQRRGGTVGTVAGQLPVAEDIDADAIGDQVVNALVPVSAAYAEEPARAPVNALMAPTLSPEQIAEMREASMRIPTGEGRTVADDIRDRVPDERSFATSPAANALLRGLEYASWLGLAAQATGGPPGAIIGAIGRGLSAPKAVVEQYARSGRNLTPTGRMQNALTEVTRESDELINQFNAMRRPEESWRLTSPRAIPEERTLPNELDYFTQRRNALLDAVERTRGARIQEYADMPNQLLSSPKALPAPPRGTAAPRREVVEAVRPDVIAERTAASRAQVRQQHRARDVNAGGPQMRAQLQFDQQVDDFIGRVVASEPRSVPQAVSLFSEQSGRPVRDVVEAMARRGYQIDNLPAHIYQGHGPKGRWQPLDQEARRLLDAIRARRRGR